MINVKAFAETLEGKPVAVLGLGMSNMAAIEAFKKQKVKIDAWDDNESKRELATGSGLNIIDLYEQDMSQYACLILAPGIPHSVDAHRIVTKARDAELEIICDLEILHRLDHGRKTIGITGTNGKSTTTALIGHILQESGIDTAVGGNIGTAALGMKLPKKGGAIVLEMSSFQLDLCPSFTPDISVLLNITPDHIDRHGSMDAYTDAKLRILNGTGHAIIGIDDDTAEKVFKKQKSESMRTIHPISVTKELDHGVYVKDGSLYDVLEPESNEEEEPQKIFDIKISTLPGVHNHQNAAAAYCAARLMGIAPETILEAMKTFPGLPHRQQLAALINGVAYVNDSKATNAYAAGRALTCYKNIYWIVGGREKEGGLSGLEAYMPNVKQAFLIGEAMDSFGSWLNNHGIPHSFCQTLETATIEAHKTAQQDRGQPGGTGTVLLSPACASFDQFDSFEQRGDIFMDYVEKLRREEEEKSA